MTSAFKKQIVETHEVFLGINKGTYRVHSSWVRAITQETINIIVVQKKISDDKWEQISVPLNNIDQAKGFILGLDYALPTNP